MAPTTSSQYHEPCLYTVKELEEENEKIMRDLECSIKKRDLAGQEIERLKAQLQNQEQEIIQEREKNNTTIQYAYNTVSRLQGKLWDLLDDGSRNAAMSTFLPPDPNLWGGQDVADFNEGNVVTQDDLELW